MQFTAKSWLQGLDPILQQYSLKLEHLSFDQLLELNHVKLEKLGIEKLGHIEMILEAIHQLQMFFEAEKLSPNQVQTSLESFQSSCETVIQAILSKNQLPLETKKKFKKKAQIIISSISPAITRLIDDLLAKGKTVLSIMDKILASYANSEVHLARDKLVSLLLSVISTSQQNMFVCTLEDAIMSYCRDLCQICSEEIYWSSFKCHFSQSDHNRATLVVISC